MQKELFFEKGDTARQIVVEGADDFHFLGHWLNEANLVDKFCFRAASNDVELLRLFPVVLKESEVKVVAIIIDADSNPLGRWSAIRQKLLTAGYPSDIVPQEAPGSSFVCEVDGLPKFGAWIMPNNSEPGYLETFAGSLIREGDRLWPIAVGAVKDLPQDLIKFHEVDLDKARVHTWLAWQESPGMPLGQALKAKLFDRDCDAGRAFHSWLIALL